MGFIMHNLTLYSWPYFVSAFENVIFIVDLTHFEFMLLRGQAQILLRWCFLWSPDLVWPENGVKLLGIISWAYILLSGPVEGVTQDPAPSLRILIGLACSRQSENFSRLVTSQSRRREGKASGQILQEIRFHCSWYKRIHSISEVRVGRCRSEG